MPLPTGMSLQCGGAKALGKTGLGGGGGARRSVEGRWKGRSEGARKVLEGVPTLEGSARRVRWKGFLRWKGRSSRVPARGSSAERDSSKGSSRGSG